MKMLKLLLLTLLLSVLSLTNVGAQQMAKFKALYLFQFAKGTSWSPDDEGKPFYITVIGDSYVAQELTAVVGSKTIGNRPITINEVPIAANLPKSDILYLGESKSAQLAGLLNSQKNNAVLIVCGGKGLCSQGAGISFSPDQGKLNFDICEANIAKYGLKVSPKLVQLGHQVY